MSLIEYALLALSSLFVIVDPIATVPAFLAMTPNDTPEHRIRMARLACQAAAVMLLRLREVANEPFGSAMELPAGRLH